MHKAFEPRKEPSERNLTPSYALGLKFWFKLYVRPHLEYGDVIFHIPA